MSTSFSHKLLQDVRREFIDMAIFYSSPESPVTNRVARHSQFAHLLFDLCEVVAGDIGHPLYSDLGLLSIIAREFDMLARQPVPSSRTASMRRLRHARMVAMVGSLIGKR